MSQLCNVWSANMLQICLFLMKLNFSEYFLLSSHILTHICTFFSWQCQNTLITLVSMHLRGIIFILHACTPPSRHHETDGRKTKRKDVTKQKTTDWNEEKRSDGVSCLQSSCSSLPGFSYCLSLLQLRTLYQPKMSLFDWCVNEQLRQILLILPLSLIVFDLN